MDTEGMTMALATPVALSITSFDASNSQEFKFVCNGGNQSVANRLTIVNAVTHEVVYQNKVTTYAYTQRVSGGTLTNGLRYYFYFKNNKIHDQKLHHNGSTANNGQIQLADTVNKREHVVAKALVKSHGFTVLVVRRADSRHHDTQNDTHEQSEKGNEQSIFQTLHQPLPHGSVNKIQTKVCRKVGKPTLYAFQISSPFF